MGFGLAGAMAGAGGAALDSLQAREKSYLEEKRSEKLAELRRKQELQTLEIQEMIEGKKPDKNLTEYTDTGVKFYNSRNELIGERAYNPAELAAKKAEQEKSALDIEAKKADISYKKANAAREYQGISLDRVRAANSGGGRGRRGGASDDEPSSPITKPRTPEQAIEALRTTNPGVVKDAARAGIPDWMIDDTAEAVLRDRAVKGKGGTTYTKSPAWSFKRALDMAIQDRKKAAL